jgi:hypothetical protein
MARQLRAISLAGTAALTLLVAGCGDGGKATGADDARVPTVARTRPTSNVVKTSRGAATLAAAADDNLETTPLSASLTPTDLVQIMLGSGVIVSNVAYKGAEIAAGTFAGPESVVGFGEGIILSTGDVGNVRGPNELDDITTINRTEGDEDLSELAGVETLDAAVLSFDFVPAGETITFDYIFASDEYNESVNTEFNDVVAFYVNGKNCAVIGDPAKPVSINTINDGNPDEGEDPTPSNSDLYRNNDLSDGGGEVNTEMDGLTTVLSCQADVNSGVKNTMKLAIADATDPVLDAVVFIKAGSLAAPNQPPTVDITAPDDNSTFARGTNITFTGTGSDLEDGALTGGSLAWTSSRDGNLGTGTSISFDDLTTGTHIITLTGTDSRGATATATIQVTITGAENHAPRATLEGPNEGDVGEELTFTTSASDPDNDTPLTCEIDWGDDTGGAIPCDGTRDHTFDAPGTYTVTLTARDPDGAAGTDTWQVTIDDVTPPACSPGTGARPTLELVGVFSRIAVRVFAQGVPEGEMLRFSFRDPDCGPWTARIDWGDGQPPSEFPISEELGPGLYNTYHLYAAPGDYTVRMTIADAGELESAEQSIGAHVIDESGTP